MADGTGRLRLQSKVAIITGGSKGIGEGIVRCFVREGAKVCFCARGAKAGKTLEKELNSAGPGEAFFLQCDVSNEQDVKRVIDLTVQKYGQIDCLVNNAGQHPHAHTIDEVSRQQFLDLLNVNVVNYFLFAKYTLPHLRQRRGNIINVSSLVAAIGQPGAVPYVCSKGAITAMTKAMAIDEAENHVRVNSISPGNVWTPMWSDLADGTQNPSSEKERGRQAQLMGRYGTLEESGNLAVYIAAEATFTTGVDFLLTGGAELDYGRKTRLHEDQNTNIAN